MQKVFGILMIFGLLYAGVEYATKGDAAFSGLLGGSDVEGTESEQKFALPGQAAGERLRGIVGRMEHQVGPGRRCQSGLPGDAEFLFKTGCNGADRREGIHDSVKYPGDRNRYRYRFM